MNRVRKGRRRFGERAFLLRVLKMYGVCIRKALHTSSFRHLSVFLLCFCTVPKFSPTHPSLSSVSEKDNYRTLRRKASESRPSAVPFRFPPGCQLRPAPHLRPLRPHSEESEKRNDFFSSTKRVFGVFFPLSGKLKKSVFLKISEMKEDDLRDARLLVGRHRWMDQRTGQRPNRETKRNCFFWKKSEKLSSSKEKGLDVNVTSITLLPLRYTKGANLFVESI